MIIVTTTHTRKDKTIPFYPFGKEHTELLTKINEYIKSCTYLQSISSIMSESGLELSTITIFDSQKDRELYIEGFDKIAPTFENDRNNYNSKNDIILNQIVE